LTVSQRVVVVGTGLIGGSVGLGLRKAGGFTVVGYDAEPGRAERAQALGAVDEATDDLARATRNADLVVVATPVADVLSAIADLAGVLESGTVVTDVGSTKGAIVSEAERLLGDDSLFVGGHPMAGTEGEGISSASPDLFEDALWILTPTASTDPEAYGKVHALVNKLGARTLGLDPAAHDQLVALVSHVPYAIATSLMVLAGREGDERVFQAAAGSFRDVTRTAGSNPKVWRDIFATNRDAVLNGLDQLSGVVAALREAVAAEEWSSFDELVAEAREARRRFPPKGARSPAEPVSLEVAIPDRPGVLAEITTAMGQSGVNIEDLWMDHTPAGGVLQLMVDGKDVAERAAGTLESMGFRIRLVVEE
jgi:prephenate dehydrogenase